MARRPSRGVTSGIGKPMKIAGRDGDLTIRKTHEGKILYVKEHGDWHPLTTGIDVRQLKKDVDRLINSVNILNNENNPFPNKRRLTLSSSDGTATLIKNDSGVLNVRNAADSADAKIISSGLEVGLETSSAAIKLDGNNHKYITMQEDDDSNGNILYINAGGSDHDGVTGSGDGATDDLSGGHFYLQGGKGSGTGCGGDIVFQVSKSGGSSNNTRNIWTSAGRFSGDNGDFILENDLIINSSIGEETTFSVANTTGIFEISTAQNSGSNTADIILDADGDIILEAAGGKINADAPVTITSTTADQFVVRYDGSNYGLMNVADDGHLEIESVGTDADMTLNAAGDIIFNSSTNSLIIPATLGEITTLSIADTSGIFTIATTASTATDADIVLDAGGDITLDSGTGIFEMKGTGTVAKFADMYAGMILGYTRIQNDSVDSGDANIAIATGGMTSLVTAQGNNLSINFIVPPSGNVEIQCSFWMGASSDGAKFSLSTGSFGSYTELDETHTYDADYTVYIDETDHNYNTVSFSVTGLTAGTDTTYYLAGLASGAGVTISHGRNRAAGTHYPPIILKAIALPATIVTEE